MDIIKTITVLFPVLLILLAPVYCSQGKIILNSGHSFSGDIRKLPDGSIWITDKNGCSLKHEKEEINGIIIYSDKDIASERFLKAYEKTPDSPVYFEKSTEYDHIINEEAKAQSLDPALVKAVIKAESNYNPKDKSHAGACGLMQLMPKTAKTVGVKNIFNPKENIRGGTKFLKDMLIMFDGNREKALAAYNAGPYAVKKYDNTIPPYKETQFYVQNVNRYYRLYRKHSRIYSYTDKKGCLQIYNAD